MNDNRLSLISNTKARLASVKSRIKQAKKGKLHSEDSQHLKRMGIVVPSSPQRKKPLLRRIATWWETTPIEQFLEDIAFIFKNAAIIDIINLAASLTIIASLTSWWLGADERRQAAIEVRENELFATWGVIKNASEDKSGVARVAAERLHRNGFSLAGLDLQETNLVNIKLDGANLRGANLEGANLRKANLKNIPVSIEIPDRDSEWILTEEEEEKRNPLGELYIEESKLQRADLRDTNLQGANLVGANLQNAHLGGANLQGANLVGANLQGANLVGANLQGASFGGADLQNADLRNTNLQNADLKRSNLRNADLKRANLQGFDLSFTTLKGIDLEEANLQDADLGKSDLKGANLRGANLQNADLGEVSLQYAYLGDANLQNTELGLTDLRDADLSSVKNLTKDQISESLLCGARLPNYISIKPNRECLALRENLVW